MTSRTITLTLAVRLGAGDPPALPDKLLAELRHYLEGELARHLRPGELVIGFGPLGRRYGGTGAGARV
ncbi:MAG TPA: hypothetical protein PLU99_11775 [Phycisphaerae bacterium]|jgi:hypothetical protein|nr:hypothetical protein [Phycisphaerae bacterium]HRS29361.1 hypothetical protein [Phycisphaerae bacterium]HRT42830.1 hypothetical protein [Phycisphaerae bacterium]